MEIDPLVYLLYEILDVLIQIIGIIRTPHIENNVL